MESIGEKIKALRVQKELKQKEFAEGICSNVTLSNIENNKQNPSMDILIKICAKLEITLQDLYGEDVDTETTCYLKNKFSRLQWLCGMHRHKEAYQLLKDSLSEDQLCTIDFQKKYYYYLGLTQVIYLKKADEAIFNFSRVLNTEDENNQETIEDILALNGLGIAYTYKKEMDKANYFFDKSMAHMKKYETDDISEKKEMTKISFNTAKHYSDRGEYQKAVDLCLEGLEVLSLIDSRYNLGALYFELGYNLFKLGDEIGGTKNYFIAKGLAFVDENEHVIEAINEELSERQIKFDLVI